MSNWVHVISKFIGPSFIVIVADWNYQWWTDYRPRFYKIRSMPYPVQLLVFYNHFRFSYFFIMKEKKTNKLFHLCIRSHQIDYFVDVRCRFHSDWFVIQWFSVRKFPTNYCIEHFENSLSLSITYKSNEQSQERFSSLHLSDP